MSSGDQVGAELSVRLVVADHYMALPIPEVDVVYSDFRGSDVKQVPILRIFGPTPDGRKACVHVHGVFPYFYIPCGVANPEPQLLYQIAASLDKALNISLKQASSTNQHVYRITMVKGLPFYGFHHKEHLFFKIFLYNPNLVKQAVDLLINGAVLGQTFQPYEAHLNFTLQFFIDFNLFGMSNVDFEKVKYRKRRDIEVTNSGDFFDNSDDILKPESTCFYEADASASHIINRQRIGKGDGIENPGLEEVWNQERERRKQLNMSMASKSLTQARDNFDTESHCRFQKMFLMKMSDAVDKPVEITPPNKEPIYYPAESLEGTQLFNASDVSVHLPSDSLLDQSTDSVRTNFNETVVDENAALECSIVEKCNLATLDSEDMDFIDLLKEMDQPIDTDSVLGTQVDLQNTYNEEDDNDDAEYSQIFDDIGSLEEAVCTEKEEIDNENDSDRKTWEDSFWDGANIPQLDGTCDDEHTKKVRKRKTPRTLSVGLSKPKKKTELSKSQEVLQTTNLGRNVASESAHVRNINENNYTQLLETKHGSCSVRKNHDTENKITESSHTYTKEFTLNAELDVSKLYDIKNNYNPIPGPSNLYHDIKKDLENTEDIATQADDFIDDSFTTTCSSKKNGLSDPSQRSQYLPNKSYTNPFSNTSQKDCSIIIKEERLSMSSIKCNESSNIRLHTSSSTIKTISSEEVLNEDMRNTVILSPKFRPPTRRDILFSLHEHNLPEINNSKPYYSSFKDVGSKIEIGQMVLKLASNSAHHQKPFNLEGVTGIEEWRKNIFMENNDMSQDVPDIGALKCLLAGNRKCILEPVARPPTQRQIKELLKTKIDVDPEPVIDVIEKVEVSKVLDELENSQVLGLEEEDMDSSCSVEKCSNKSKETNLNQSLQVSMQPDGSFLCHSASLNENQSQSIDVPVAANDFLTVMIIEIHAEVRHDLNPDPQTDAMLAVFLSVSNDSPPGHFLPKNQTEVYVVNEEMNKPFERCGLPVEIKYVHSERLLIETIVGAIKKWDPDILCGFEIELNSWGYLLERSEVLGIDLVPEISRITEIKRQKKWRSEENNYEGKILGRVIFNVWRMLRHELALSSYSFENTMYQILKERVPNYSPASLFSWWRHESSLFRWIPFEYYLTKLSGTLRMLEKLDMINRTSELARLFGLQWWEVVSRGSQFRVESLMLRAARPLNLIALSPSVRQRATMKAPEYLPLIFEPESRFYSDPVIVLDFQSLYPSMMIAYNYCFSTCIGRIQNINGQSSYEFGAWRLRVARTQLETLARRGLVHWSPAGVGFVSPSVRRGVLPSLLRRILAARQAVKKTMAAQTDEAVKKSLHSRQLGLKLIANVTYGYTAANFSGRMPCVEVGDSVVAKGRETLERAIRLVEENKQWNVKVVYGDTDSMFVLVPGATREKAFWIGREIADAVTADNPAPVALKLEKVYQPCILQTKKRYVGFMYESAEQRSPVYEAKGIETVRRDGCPAGVKVLQRALCSLFESRDVSAVRREVCATLARLAEGRLSAHELVLTREYRGAAGYRPGAHAPPLEIARRLSARDRRSVPRAGERVSWVVVAGAPGLPLVKLARTPRELRADPALRPHAAYYAMRVILPPLHRCLSLVGADVFAWYGGVCVREAAGAGGIARYLRRARCAACRSRSQRPLCASCHRDPSAACRALAVSLHSVAACARYAHMICESCCGHALTESCDNWECPLLWRRQTANNQLQEMNQVVQTLPEKFKKMLT